MKIVIACDSFKESCSAQDIVRWISDGIHGVAPDTETVLIPIADGGEGTIDAYLYCLGGERKYATVTGPMGHPISASFGLLNNGTAIIEMAEASGLPLVPEEERDPRYSTSYGTGELIRAALDAGCRDIVLGLGGSATNDAGVGMAQALGARFLDKHGNELPYGGAALANLCSIDLSDMDPRLMDTKILAACDVKNPLCGPTGASFVYGPQKGADPSCVQQLDKCLFHFNQVAKAQLGMDISETAGAGAAGGMGAGVMLFCKGSLRSGIEILLDAVDFDSRIADADLVITGEGQIDGQSVNGKVPVGVARRVKAKKNIPVIALVGGIGSNAAEVYREGIDSILTIVPGPTSLHNSITQCQAFITDTANRLMRIVTAVQRCP